MAALFAAVIALAPASAHPGHADHGAGAVASHHAVDASAAMQPDSFHAASLASSRLIEHKPDLVETAVAVSGPSRDDGCRQRCCGCCGAGTNCCSVGCGAACLPCAGPILTLARAAAARAGAAYRAPSGVEPASPLEPPKSLA